MKFIILNCFETYSNRISLITSLLKDLNIDVKIIQSNFQHMAKTKIQAKKDYTIFVNTRPYKKNLSIERILSHNSFSKEAIKLVKEENPDIVYCVLPPNSLAREVIKYKRQQPNVKVIFDIIDLWPETYPVKYFNNNIFFKHWRELRDNNLIKADKIITECDYYQKILKFEEKKINATTLYMSRPDKNVEIQPVYNKDIINLCYLGSVNNIIDISLIKEIIENIQTVKNVTLHIIGDGENLAKFISAIESINANVIHYGKIYDAIEKQRIFNKCHFGINIMKSSVVVGLTMKSIDYFEGGLPIINTIPGDTADFVDQYKAGINYSSDANSKFINFIKNYHEEKFLQSHNNAKRLFRDKLSEKKFKKDFLRIVEEI